MLCHGCSSANSKSIAGQVHKKQDIDIRRSSKQKNDCNHDLGMHNIYIYTWNFRLCEIIARSWNSTFFCCLGYFLLFSKNNAVSCLGFWLLGNACQPDLFLRFLGGKLRFLDGKLRRFKCLSAPWWEVQVPQNVPKPKNARRQKKMQVPPKSNNFWKSKNLASFGRSRYIYIYIKIQAEYRQCCHFFLKSGLTNSKLLGRLHFSWLSVVSHWLVWICAITTLDQSHSTADIAIKMTDHKKTKKKK